MKRNYMDEGNNRKKLFLLWIKLKDRMYWFAYYSGNSGMDFSAGKVRDTD